MEYAMILVNQVFIMFLLICVGFIIFKLKIVNAETNKQITKLLLYVIGPALVLNTYQMDYNPQEAKNMLLGFFLSFISIVLAIFLSHVLRLGGKKESLATERFGVIFTNCGFMAIPLISAIFGNIGVFYANTYITIFNIFVWTFGVALMQPKGKAREKRSLTERLKPFVTPMMICIVVGLVMYFTGFKLPSQLRSATEYIASMNTPLAMVVAGFYIAQSDLLTALKKGRVYFVAGVKCFFIPLVVLLAFYFLPLDNTLRMTILISASCPTASNTMLFANTFDGDVEMASNIFAICTLMCVISLPIVIFIAQMFVFS